MVRPLLLLLLLLSWMCVSASGVDVRASHRVSGVGFPSCEDAKARCALKCAAQEKECLGKEACVPCPVTPAHPDGGDHKCWVVPAGCSPGEIFHDVEFLPNGAVPQGI